MPCSSGGAAHKITRNAGGYKRDAKIKGGPEESEKGMPKIQRLEDQDC
ncbi:MAG: hypothetical protein ACE5PM_09830 [Candidatus Hydrothermarchaeales archaeon]